VPVAQIVPVEKTLTQKRPIGLAEGEFTVPQDFNDPLPDREIAAFCGNA
jgi:antitoxin (DNA-binding transcriptional repressor) of toxin-antitoxin stability system